MAGTIAAEGLLSQNFNHVAVTVPGDLLEGVELQPIQAKYGGLLQVFRLPLTPELVYLAKDAGGRE